MSGRGALLSAPAPTLTAMAATPHTNAAMGVPGRRWQRVLNESWPQRDERGPHARDVKEGTERTRVSARVRWADDGLEVVPGLVTRRHGRHVFVELNDPRLAVRGVWLTVDDVRPC